ALSIESREEESSIFFDGAADGPAELVDLRFGTLGATRCQDGRVRVQRLVAKLIWRTRACAAKRLSKESVVVVGAVNLQAVERAFLSADAQIAGARGL